MSTYVIQLFLLIILVGCGSAIAMNNPFGGSTFYIGNQRTPKARRMRRESPPLTGTNVVFLLVSLACMVGLYLTGFSFCSFMLHWFPNLNPVMRGMFCTP